MRDTITLDSAYIQHDNNHIYTFSLPLSDLAVVAGVAVVCVVGMVVLGLVALVVVAVVGCGNRFSLHRSVSQHSITTEEVDVPHNSATAQRS